MTITRPIEYIIAAVGNTVEGIINANYKIIIEVFIKIYFKIIAKRNAIFVKS